MLPITNINGETELLTNVASLKLNCKVNGEKTLSFKVVPAENNEHAYPFVETESSVEFDGKKYIIKQTDEKDWGSKSIKQTEAVHEFFDHMISRYVYEEHSGSQTFDDALSRVFGPTDYDYVIQDGQNAQEFDAFGRDNCLALFDEVMDRYGSEFRVDGNTVYLEQEIGSDVEFQYRYKHNVKAIDKEVDTKNLATVIRGFGGEPDDDGNYPVELTYESPNKEKFGEKHAPAVYDERYTTEEGLQERLERDLVDEPELSLTIDLADLRAAGYNYHTVNEGDRGWVIYEPMNIMINVRIVEIDEEYKFVNGEWQPYKTEVTLSNLREKASEQMTQFSNTSKQVDRLKRGEDKLPFAALDNAVTNATNALQSAQTELNFEDGILAVNPDNPNEVVIFNSAGIGVSTDGGESYENAMTGNGLVADVVTSGSMLYDRMQGGTAIFGGEENGFGVARWLDDEGDLVAEMDAQQGGFDNLYAADFRSDHVEADTVPVYSDSNYTLYVAGSDGDDENDGRDSSEPLYSAREAARRIPQTMDGDITIDFDSNYDIQENVIFGGITGSGTLTIDLNNAKFRGYMKFASCNVRIVVDGDEIERTDSGTYLIDNESSQYLNITNLKLNGSGHDYGVRTWRNGSTYATNVEVYNVDTCFYGTSLARMFIGGDSAGLGSSYGVRVVNGAMAHAGTGAPMGEESNTRESDSGIIVGSWEHDAGSEEPPPPEYDETTSTFETTSGASWRPQGPQWRSDYTYQGQWSNDWGPYKGLWLFGNEIRNAVFGANITRIRVRARRASEGGNYTNSTVVFRTHEYENQPSSEPSFNSSTHEVTFDRGERKWVTLPSSFHNDFENGARGLGLYTTSTADSHYVIMDTDIEVEITWEVEV